MPSHHLATIEKGLYLLNVTMAPRALFLGCPVALSAVIFVVYLESGHVGFGHSTSPVESRL